MRRLGILCGGVLLCACGFPSYAYVDEGTDASTTTDSSPSDTAPPDDVPVVSDGCAKPNGCGGCNDKGIKGERCDPCGQWTCSGTTVTCVAASPSPGSTCGRCGTSTYACTVNGTSACAVEDDRLVYVDASFETKTDKLWTANSGNEVLVSFKTERALSYFDASLALKRVAAGSGTDGTVTLTVYAGNPKDGLAPLATVDMPALSIGTTGDFKAFPFTEISPRPLGTSMSIGLKVSSAAWAIELYGGGASAFPAAPTTTSWWHRNTGGTWLEEATTDLAHVLRGKACPP